MNIVLLGDSGFVACRIAEISGNKGHIVYHAHTQGMEFT